MLRPNLRPRRLLAALLAPVLVLTAAGDARAVDDFTLYELLEPGSNQFAITYDTTFVGGTRGDHYFNAIRAGAEATDEKVVNRGTGEELPFEVIDGVRGKELGMPARVPDESHFIMVALPGVPDGAEVRLRIYKTYKDAESYYAEGDTIVFERSLGIRANAVVLPPGYELIETSIPVIVTTEEDGRVKVSMLNDRNDALQVKLVGRRLPGNGTGGAR